MQLLGLQLNKPSFWDITLTMAGCALLVLLVFACCLALGYVPDLVTKLLFTVSLMWGALCSLFGLRPSSGRRHVVVIVGGWILLGTVSLFAVQAASV